MNKKFGVLPLPLYFWLYSVDYLAFLYVIQCKANLTLLLFLSTNHVQAVNCPVTAPPQGTFPASDLYSGDFFMKFERKDAFLFLTSVLEVHQLK